MLHRCTVGVWVGTWAFRFVYIQVLILIVGVHLARLHICGQVNNMIGNW